MEREQISTPVKLISATLHAWEREGAAGAAARAISRAAGLPVSSIYYHFGTFEHLLVTAQGEALAAAEQWCALQIDAVQGDVDGARALGLLLATVIDDWCETQRPLAFAWVECQLMALRDPAYCAACAQWDALWQRFWGEICERLGLADVAGPTAWLFNSTSRLHLLRWRRPVDRAALSDLCDGWAGWLDGRLASPAPWFDHARRNTTGLLPPPPTNDASADTIATAAAAIIARQGIRALTYRAVAAEAGVTLGMVSYKFRTIGDLLQAAFEVIYQRIAPPAVMEAFAAHSFSREEALSRISAIPMREDLLASDELLAASARAPELQALVARLRYDRGRSTGPMLQALLGDDRPIAPIDAAIFSGILSGRSRAYACSGGVAAPDPLAGLTGDFAALLVRLGCN